jgi:diaminohydroxyphosphoribosylaminopyrimidine deaminase / 5-amino-6-(5-phosphoribosylamino)uracil reductase
LFEMNIQSVLAEGGTMLLQSFIDAGLWDEARVIINNGLVIENGKPGPVLTSPIKIQSSSIFSDSIYYYIRQSSNE